MTGLSRRGFLAGALAVGVAGCGSDPDLHPALRTPRPFGVVALLTVPPRGPATLGVVDVRLVEGVRADLERLRRAAASDATMVGVGAALLGPAGLASAAPAGFGPMPAFPGDVLDPQRSDAAVLLQVEGDSAASVERRANSVLDALTTLRVAWRTPVSRAPIGVRDGKPLQHNTFGFDEGHGNPTPDDSVLLGAGPAVPAWAVGGSYLAVRVIRMAHGLWDADDDEKQRRIIGRHPDGRWLDGTDALAEPAFAADPDGAVTPLDSHVRRINPRTADSPPPAMLRRSWTYRGGTAAGGRPDEGMVFMAFQRDLATGFVRAQQRLTGDALSTYLLAVGGGYFLVPTPDGLATLLDS